MRSKWLSLLLAMIVVAGASLPASAQPQVPAGPCDFDHHERSALLDSMLGNDQASVQINLLTGDMLVFMRIAQCGGRWLLAIYESSKFKTHFFATREYINNEIFKRATGPTSWVRLIIHAWDKITTANLLMVPWVIRRWPLVIPPSTAVAADMQPVETPIPPIQP